MKGATWLGLVIAVPLSAFGAGAQTWPARQIEMIVPYAAGGGVDIIFRSVATAMSEHLGQNVVVVNRDGASGTLGFNALAAADPDGYTLGAGPTTPISSSPFLVKGVRYRVESFEYICQVFENVFAIVVGPHSEFKSAPDLLVAAAANPRGLSYGHAGAGSIPHLSVENLADALKLKLQGVPFRGDSPMLQVLLKGDLDFGVAGLSSLRGQGVRVLAIFADERHQDLSEVPTAKEMGVTTPVPPGFNGVYAPKGLPAEVREALERSCAKAVESDVVSRRIANTGQTVRYLTGEQFHVRTAADYAFKAGLLHRLGLDSQK